MHPKSFYYSYHASNDLFEIDKMLVDEILKTGPTSVFDFGCGTGKILKRIHKHVPAISLCGMDMSFINIIHARAQNNLPCVMVGDEYYLDFLTSFDCVTTCSVLCHIEDISRIMEQLKRIAIKSIIIAETTDVIGEFYYSHDYIAYGFTYTGREWMSTTGAHYKIYKWVKE